MLHGSKLPDDFGRIYRHIYCGLLTMHDEPQSKLRVKTPSRSIIESVKMLWCMAPVTWRDCVSSLEVASRCGVRELLGCLNFSGRASPLS